MDLDKSLNLLDESMMISKRGLNRSKIPRQSVLQDSYFDLSSVGDGGTTITQFSKNKTNQLYCGFLEILQKRPNSAEVFPTIEDLIQLCETVIKDISDLERKTENRHVTDDEFWELEHEKNTWKLLCCLYKDRCQDQKDDMDIDDNLMMLYATEKQVVDHLYTSKY